MPYVMCDPIDFDDQILVFERGRSKSVCQSAGGAKKSDAGHEGGEVHVQ